MIPKYNFYFIMWDYVFEVLDLLHRSLSKCTVLFPSWRSEVSMTDDIDDDDLKDDNNLTTKSRTFLMLSYFSIIHMPTMKMDYRGKMQMSCSLRDQRFDLITTCSAEVRSLEESPIHLTDVSEKHICRLSFKF